MTRACAALVGLALAGSLVAGVAFARPVRVGRFVEIPYGVSPQHPWPTGHGDPRRTARARSAAPSTVPTKAWESRVGVGRVFAPAVAADGSLFVGSQAGVAMVAPDGAVRWSLRLGLVSGTPSITPEGQAAVGAQPGQAMSVGNGRIRHRATVGGGVRGSPLVLGDGSLVLAAYDQAVHRYDAEGRRLFRTPVSGNVRGMAARTRERIVVPAGEEVLFLTLDGAIAERGSVGAEIALGPAVADDGSVWVMTAEGVLLAVEPDGSVGVRKELGVRPSLASNLAIAPDGTLRLATADAGLLALGAGGTERWRYDADGPIVGGVTVDARGRVLCVTVSGELLLLGEDGQKVWGVSIDGRSDAAPVLSERAIYVPTFGGTLQAWTWQSPAES